ncbi:sulfotransferase [Marinobacter mobilis]|uniref:sulfotransferase n=1 Tax=Marinobacter mobilis TaxID=488533 RepID=UPI0035C6B165
MKELLYITGSGRSGSTLFDMLLNTNPDIAALGEVHRFSMNIDSKEEAHKCTCGKSIMDCDFWQDIIEVMELKGLDPHSINTTWHWNHSVGVDDDGINIKEKVAPTNIFQRLNIFNVFLGLGLGKLLLVAARYFPLFRRSIKIFEDSWMLYEAVSQSSGKGVVVDGTKTPGRLMGLAAINPSNVPLKVIYLCRDGRAVAHARMGRQNLGMRQAAKIWRLEHQKIQRALRVYGLPFIVIKYEDLCSDPHSVMKKVFNFSSARDSEIDLDFRSGSHSLGGNPMRKRLKEKEIILNEKWKTGLSKSDLEIFDEVAGEMNEKLGYTC